MLIRDGATLIRSADDVIEAIGPVAEPVAEQAQLFPEIPQGPPRRSADGPKLHQEILSRLGPSPVAEDQLIRDIDLPLGTIAPVLLDLELEGEITRQAGGLLSRNV